MRNQTISCEMQKTFQVNDKTLVGVTGLASDFQTLQQKFEFRHNMYRLREEREMSPKVFSNMVSNLLYEKRCATALAGRQRAAAEAVLTHLGIMDATRRSTPACASASPQCLPPRASRAASARTFASRSSADWRGLRTSPTFAGWTYSAHRSAEAASHSRARASVRRAGPLSYGPARRTPTVSDLPPASPPAQVYTDDFILAGDCPEAMYGLCESMYKPDLEADDLFEVLAQCLLSGVDRDCLAGWGCTVMILTPEGVTTRHLKGRMD